MVSKDSIKIKTNENSEKYSINGEGRRVFLKSIAMAGGGLAGLKSAIQKVTGANPAGVPLVQTLDRSGNPSDIKYISKERKRRLEVYKNLDIDVLTRTYQHLSGISVTEGDTGNLHLQMFVDSLVENEIPGRIQDVPVTKTERLSEDRGEYAECRAGNTYRPIEANPGIGVEHNDASYYDVGTIGLVGYHNDFSSTYPCLITAYHVVDERANSKIYQPGNGEVIGYYESADKSNDAVKYSINSSESYDPGGTHSSSQAEMSGWWTFSGLSDATANDGESVSCSFAGRQTCYDETECFETQRDAEMYYEAHYRSDIAESGDSGGPFVDSNGKCLGFLNGPYEYSMFGDTRTGLNGPVAGPVMDNLSVVLDDPTT